MDPKYKKYCSTVHCKDIPDMCAAAQHIDIIISNSHTRYCALHTRYMFLVVVPVPIGVVIVIAWKRDEYSYSNGIRVA